MLLYYYKMLISPYGLDMSKVNPLPSFLSTTKCMNDFKKALIKTKKLLTKVCLYVTVLF